MPSDFSFLTLLCLDSIKLTAWAAASGPVAWSKTQKQIHAVTQNAAKETMISLTEPRVTPHLLPHKDSKAEKAGMQHASRAWRPAAAGLRRCLDPAVWTT